MKKASITAMIVGIIGIGASVIQMAGGDSFNMIFGQFFISFTLFGYALIQYKDWDKSGTDE